MKETINSKGLLDKDDTIGEKCPFCNLPIRKEDWGMDMHVLYAHKKCLQEFRYKSSLI